MVKTLHLILIIVAVGLLLFTVMEVRSCVKEARVRESGELQGRLDALTKKAEEAEQKLQEEIQVLEGEKLHLIEANAVLVDYQDTLHQADSERAAEIQELKAKLEEMEIPTEITEHPAYKNVLSQARRWQDRFYLMEEDRDSEHKKFLNMETLYQKQISITLREISQRIFYKEALDAATQSIESYQKEISSRRRWSRVERVAGLTGWGLFALKAIGVF